MYKIGKLGLGLWGIALLCASCAVEPSIDHSNVALRGPTSLDPPPAPSAAPDVVRAALTPGAGQVGFYDMTAGSGQAYEIAPISAAGATAINIDDPSAAALANLNVLFVTNPDNSGFGSEYVSRLGAIAAAVQNGMVLVIHDRTVDGAASILPGGAGFGIFRDFAEGADINIRDASTPVTLGLDNLSLDNGNFSDHGFALDSTLPIGSKLILSSTTPSRIVTFCYPFGSGAVIYSTIPLDFYLQGFSGTAQPQGNLDNIYSPNVIKYAIAGACNLHGPRPTPNFKI